MDEEVLAIAEAEDEVAVEVAVVVAVVAEQFLTALIGACVVEERQKEM